MRVPNVCIPWIKLQRSGYGKKTIELFKKNIINEFNEMQPFLPEYCRSILDIGCGLGGIDVFLSQEYDNPKLYLMDNTKVSKKPIYGFDRGESFYNSFMATNELMKANEIKNYEFIDISDGIPELNNIDLVISILSWGYHYSLSVYLDWVYKILSKDGMLIIDIREYTNGVNILKKKFKMLLPIRHENKAYRVCCIKGSSKNGKA